MKKLNQKGFVLSETLVVTVFMMIIFTLIYTSMYPIIGLYEQREVYDDVDGQYAVYWVKRMIENDHYKDGNINIGAEKYVRFSCNDLEDSKKQMCSEMVNALEINNCRADGTYCDIFITNYQIGELNSSGFFKGTVNGNGAKQKFQEGCAADESACKKKYYDQCCYDNTGDDKCFNINIFPTNISSIKTDGLSDPDDVNVKKTLKKCYKETKRNIFSSAFRDYVNSLPNYTNNTTSDPQLQHRVFIVIHHKKDGNNYYSFANMGVK